MNKFTFLCLLVQLARVWTEEVVSYANYKVYTVAEEEQGAMAVRSLQENQFSVLTQRTAYDENNNAYTVRSYLVPGEDEKAFRRALDHSNANYSITVRDLGKAIDEERRSYQASGRRSFSGLGPVTKTYYSYDEMIKYLNSVAKIKNPDTGENLAQLQPIGKTYEGRPMYLVKISSDHEAKKPIIFFEAGIHAREWTAPAAALYMVNQLVENYTYNAKVLENIDFYIVPVTNPDGYEYSRKTDRLWRKTRSVNGKYFGVDGNRNFDFHWGEEGTSRNPSSEIYIGPYPFSEQEIRNVRDAGKKYAKRIKTFVSVHAYGPYIVYPWSYKRMEPAPQADLMAKITKAAAKAIKKFNGTQYEVGPSAYLMYPAAGGADDYFKGVLGVDLSFTFELSSGLYGTFITPTKGLYRIVAEAFEGFKVMADYASKY